MSIDMRIARGLTFRSRSLSGGSELATQSHSGTGAGRKRSAARYLLPVAIAQTIAIVFLGYSVLDLTKRANALGANHLATAETPPAAPDYSLTASEIRVIVREEVAALRAGPTGEPGAATAIEGAASAQVAVHPQQPADPTYQGKVRQQLRTHISNGRMSNVEIDNFLGMVAELPEAERTQMLRELTAAINAGRLEARF